MKKMLKKVFLTSAAVLAVSAAMSISALAAVSYDSTSNAITYSGTATADEQVTVLVVKGTDVTEITADDILYIDQQAADSTGAYSFVMPLGDVTDISDVTVLGGGENFSQIVSEEVSLGGDEPEYTLGDVNADGAIDSSDAYDALAHYVEIEILTGDKFSAADVNKSGVVDSSDAYYILQYYVEIVTDFADIEGQE